MFISDQVLEATKMSFTRVNKLVHPYKHCTVIKRNELSGHTKTWMKLKCILLNERGKSEKLNTI